MSESAEHHALVELFRHHPKLAAWLAGKYGRVKLPRGYTARVGDPVQRPKLLASDVVIELRDARGKVRLAILVEVQRSIEKEKLETWPAYLWLERRRRHCECHLLVIATRPEVAAWAAQPIHSGPGNVTTPIVLGPQDVPWITRLAEARAFPSLAVLSAAMHAEAPGGVRVIRAAAAGLLTLHEPDTRQYNALVFRSLSQPAIDAILEDLMKTIEQENQEWEESLKGWREFCRTSLPRMILAHTKLVAEVKTRRAILLQLLKSKKFVVKPALRKRVLECRDKEQLDRWLRRVVSAPNVTAVFAA